MRGSLVKQLRAVFEEGLKRRVKDVRRFPLASASSGSIAWVIGENEKAAAFIVLVVSPRNDRFTIEVAWSTKKRLPEQADMVPGEEGNSGELRFRLSRIWQRSGFETWYDLEHEEDYPDVRNFDPFPPDESVCFKRIPAKANRALDALEAHGIPYLKEVVGLPI